MKMTRTALYNVYGLTAEDKSIIFNALTEYSKRFGQTEPRGLDIARLATEFSKTDEADEMSNVEAKASIGHIGLGDSFMRPE
jgi:protoporphyrinogen oxidase